MNNTEITKHLKLPFQFDEQKLLTDLAKVLNTEWKPHFNIKDYSGKWKSIALYAPNGNSNHIFASPNETVPILETKILKGCNYFKEVLSQFHCPLLSVRLLNLGAGAIIKPHKDYNLGYENDCFRLHVPITTNPEVEFILDDTLLQMEPGECWYTNVNYTHSVENLGTTDRIHLVLDGQRNSWSDELFLSLVPKECLFVEETKYYDIDTIARIIEELNQSQPQGYLDAIKDLKNRMNLE